MRPPENKHVRCEDDVQPIGNKLPVQVRVLKTETCEKPNPFFRKPIWFVFALQDFIIKGFSHLHLGLGVLVILSVAGRLPHS